MIDEVKKAEAKAKESPKPEARSSWLKRMNDD